MGLCPLLSRSGIKRIHLKQDEEGDKGVDSACDLESELEKTVGSGKRETWRIALSSLWPEKGEITEARAGCGLREAQPLGLQMRKLKGGEVTGWTPS